MSELTKALMNRDDLTLKEALLVVQDMQKRILAGENPEEVLFDEGFEPDYIFDVI